MRAGNDNVPWAAQRKKIKTYLTGLRDKAGLSQRALAAQISDEEYYYTFVSTVENGHAKIPQDKIVPWADALGVDRAEFCIFLIRHYEPGYNACLKPVLNLWEQR